MSDKSLKKPLAIAMGATFAAAMSTAPIASADSNPFGMQPLESGYMQLAEGKCGEGKCGGKMKKEAKCGAEHAKMHDGKCGGKKMEKEGKCGEGKCGDKKMEKEGKCGGKKMEKEGKCGEGKCGGKKMEKEGKCGNMR